MELKREFNEAMGDLAESREKIAKETNDRLRGLREQAKDKWQHAKAKADEASRNQEAAAREQVGENHLNQYR